MTMRSVLGLGWSSYLNFVSYLRHFTLIPYLNPLSGRTAKLNLIAAVRFRVTEPLTLGVAQRIYSVHFTIQLIIVIYFPLVTYPNRA